MPTGRFLIRMPAELHARLRREAGHRSTSLNALCVELLQIGVREAAGEAGGAWTPWVEKTRAVCGDGLRGVLLFGSFARGEERDGSDVDLLVVLHDRVPITRALYRRWDGEPPADDAVHPHFVHLPADRARPGSLWLEVALDGMVLHDPSREVARALSEIRWALVSGVADFRIVHGQRYWIHRSAEEAHAQ